MDMTLDWRNEDIIAKAIRADGHKNCPNCGAPIESEKCSYCGTTFIDFAAMDADKPFYMKIKHDGEIFIMKVMLRNISIEYEPIALYADNRPMYMPGNTEISIDFIAIH